MQKRGVLNKNSRQDLVPPGISGQYYARIPSDDKSRHGFDGQKWAHTASSPLTIRQVFSAGLSLSGRISAPAKLPAPDRNGFSSDFCFFETQVGWRPPRRKEQKAPERRPVRRVCPCQAMVSLYMKAVRMTIKKCKFAGFHFLSCISTVFISSPT